MAKGRAAFPGLVTSNPVNDDRVTIDRIVDRVTTDRIVDRVTTDRFASTPRPGLAGHSSGHRQTGDESAEFSILRVISRKSGGSTGCRAASPRVAIVGLVGPRWCITRVG